MRLLTKDVAAMVGLKEATIRRYRIRGTFPEPDGVDFGHPWWKEATVTAWLEARRIRHKCPHGCGPLQWVDTAWYCKECGDEWAQEVIGA